MDVFVLHHVHTFDDGDEDVRLIGVYSSPTAAAAAIERLQQQPGFCDAPQGFTINQYSLDVDHWTEGYVTVSSNQEV